MRPSPSGNSNETMDGVAMTDRSPIVKVKRLPDPNGNGDLGDFYIENGVLKKSHGYNWVVASLFIIADMAGAGIVALPTSIMKASFYIGILIILIMATLAAISAILLGKAWMVMLRMYPIYRTHCRRPYPEMGYRALGETMRTVVSAVLLVTQFGVSTTFLLLVSKATTELLHSLTGYSISNCFVIIAMALLLLPFTFRKSPKDFWPVIVVATLCTFAAVILIIIGASIDHKCAKEAEFPPFSLQRSVLAVGVFLFTYGGHAIFPTIQNDMQVPSEFSKSAVLAFSMVTLTNLSVILLSGFIYGDSLRSEGVVMSIQTVGVQRGINFFILLHCFLTFPLMVNPLSQEIESFLGISLGFDIRRYFFRSSIVAVIAFTALTVPNFEYFMGLIGGSLVVLSVMVLPAFFYILLSCREQVSTAREIELNGGLSSSNNIKSLDSATYVEIDFKEVLKRTDMRLLFVCGIMFTIGIAACVVSMVTSISTIISLESDELKPCYWSLFFDDGMSRNDSMYRMSEYNCCGRFQNISLNGNQSYCSAPNLHFYIR